MRTLSWVIVVAVLQAACLGGGSRPRTPGTASGAGPAVPAALHGQWELITLEAQGQPRRASGRVSFDAFNNIEMHVELAPDEAGVTPPRVVVIDFRAKALAREGQLSYVGVERGARPEQMVPGETQPEEWRSYALEGDTLRIWREGGGSLTFSRGARRD